MEELFNIAYTIDDNEEQIKMLEMSIDTLLNFNKVDNIYIMYFCDNLDIIKNKLSKFNNIVNIEYFFFDIDLVDKYFPELPNVINGRLRYPSLARWFMTKIIPYDNYWYIDTDVLFNANIREIFLNYQKDKLFFAFNGKTYNYNQNNNLIPFIKYYHTLNMNGGIVYTNAKLFNEMNLFNEIVEHYKQNLSDIIFVNQSTYFYLFDKYSNICHVEYSDIYNITPIYNKDNSNIKIYHFNGPHKDLFFKYYDIIMKKL